MLKFDEVLGDEFMLLTASALVQACPLGPTQAELIVRRRAKHAKTEAELQEFFALAGYIYRLTQCGHVWTPVT